MTKNKTPARKHESATAASGKDASRTIQTRSLADPDPYKASESPLLNNPEWGVQLKPQPAHNYQTHKPSPDGAMIYVQCEK